MHDAAEETNDPDAINLEMRGQAALGDHGSYRELAERHRRGWRFEALPVTEDGRPLGDRALGRPEDDPIPVLLVRGNGGLRFNTPPAPLDAAPGDMLVAFVPPAGEAARPAA